MTGDKETTRNNVGVHLEAIEAKAFSLACH